MAYTPDLAEIRQLLALRKWHGEVVAAIPASQLPPYPNPIRGERYYDTTNNRFIECREDRKWQGAFLTTPTTGAVYALRATGQCWILTPAQGWQPYEEFLTALGTYLGAGGGVTSYATPTELKDAPGAGLVGGEIVTVVDVPILVDSDPDVYIHAPISYVYTPTYDSSGQATRTENEPGTIIPQDIWDTTKLGGWFDMAAWLFTMMVREGGTAELNWPLPLNHAPAFAFPYPYKFLTGPNYVTEPGHNYQIATRNVALARWDYEDPSEGAPIRFIERWALPGGNQRMFCLSYTPSFTPKWSFFDYNSETDEPYTPVFNGFSTTPPVGAQLGEVYLVAPGAGGLWSTHDNQMAWLDGNGTDWLFSGMAGLVGGFPTPTLDSTTFAMIREKGVALYYVLLTSSGWVAQRSGFTITAPTGPVSGASGIIRIPFSASKNPLETGGIPVFNCATSTGIPGGGISVATGTLILSIASNHVAAIPNNSGVLEITATGTPGTYTLIWWTASFNGTVSFTITP